MSHDHPTDADQTTKSPGGKHDDRGPKAKAIDIHVNEHLVHMPDDHATGLQIKKHAIHDGVNIELDFQLVEELENGRTRNVGNHDEVKLKHKSRFLANDGDDNS